MARTPRPFKAQGSSLTGDELISRLEAVKWTGATGLQGTTTYKYLNGHHKIPMTVQRCLGFVESDPLCLLALPELATPRVESRARRQALVAQRCNAERSHPVRLAPHSESNSPHD